MPEAGQFNADSLDISAALAALERDGIIVIRGLWSDDQLRTAQTAFRARLGQMTWNNLSGYERSELFRLMVEDVLQLEQSFVDLAVHPMVMDLARRYIGDGAQLCEAKGWRSLATTREFHGWHADAWYDQDRVTDRIPRELKLATYLTDVQSGGFNYLPGSHRKQPPNAVRHNDYARLTETDFINLLAPAGTTFVFDTSGVHRQGHPMLQDREAIFYCMHDASEPIQREDLAYYRYHPLLLNAAFLGGLEPEQTRFLGFGDQRHFVLGHRRTDPHPRFSTAARWLWRGVLEAHGQTSLIASKWQGLLRRLRRT